MVVVVEIGDQKMDSAFLGMLHSIPSLYSLVWNLEILFFLSFSLVYSTKLSLSLSLLCSPCPAIIALSLFSTSPQFK